jgi:hypothetical protein
LEENGRIKLKIKLEDKNGRIKLKTFYVLWASSLPLSKVQTIERSMSEKKMIENQNREKKMIESQN